MASNDNEELATIILNGIMKARSYEKYYAVTKDLFAIGRAYKCASKNSLLEDDLKNYKESQSEYSEEGICKIMKELSKKLGRKGNFQTIPLFESLKNGLVKELGVLQDQWQTIKIIDAFDSLFALDEQKISEIIYAIKDKKQRRLAIICARIYFEKFEEAFEIFRLDKEI